MMGGWHKEATVLLIVIQSELLCGTENQVTAL